MVGLLDTDVPLKRKQKVVATTDLPGVPEGTAGKVLLVNGFEWIRYRVLFENGRDIGTLDRKYVGTQKEYDDLVVRREAGEFDVVESAATGEAVAEGEAVVVSGDDKSGGRVPAHLLERTRARRAALGV